MWADKFYGKQENNNSQHTQPPYPQFRLFLLDAEFVPQKSVGNFLVLYTRLWSVISLIDAK